MTISSFRTDHSGPDFQLSLDHRLTLTGKLAQHLEMEKIDNAASKYEMVAAIDFGTTYSGYAYSYRYDQDNIYVNASWASGTNLNKVPTAILFDENMQFLAFGEDAVTKYSNHAEMDEEKNYYFFHRFKMKLYNEKCVNSVNRNLYLPAANGKAMKALDVFSAAINYLKNHMIKTVNERNAANNMDVSSIRWVLTVPAIWSDSAKQFMREAAERAGIPPHGLVIALEPEAASLFCQTLPPEKMSAETTFKKVGAKYLVLDNGGGTVDVTVHQMLDGGRIRELYKATGGAWGGTKVDEEFVDFLVSMFSQEVVEKVKKSHPADWVEMMRDFERIKRGLDHEKDDCVMFVMKPCIRDVYKETFDVDLFAAFQNNLSKKGTTLHGKSRIKIPKSVIVEMIVNVSNSIREHVKGLMNKYELEGLNFIMSVGGFSNSSIVLENIKEFVGESIPVVRPEEAELAVVKGAVIFGWKPELITLRKSKKTCGISMVSNFKEGINPERLAFFDDDGTKKCKMVFDKLVTANQDINIQQTVTRTYFPVYNDQTEMNIILYHTEQEEVYYCDEPGVSKLGFLVVPMAEKQGNKNRKVAIDVYFGDTEFFVHGRDLASNTSVKAKYDFL